MTIRPSPITPPPPIPGAKGNHMKITDLTIKLFNWEGIPPRRPGDSATSQLGLVTPRGKGDGPAVPPQRVGCLLVCLLLVPRDQCRMGHTVALALHVLSHVAGRVLRTRDQHRVHHPLEHLESVAHLGLGLGLGGGFCGPRLRSLVAHFGLRLGSMPRDVRLEPRLRLRSLVARVGLRLRLLLHRVRQHRVRQPSRRCWQRCRHVWLGRRSRFGLYLSGAGLSCPCCFARHEGPAAVPGLAWGNAVCSSLRLSEVGAALRPEPSAFSTHRVKPLTSPLYDCSISCKGREGCAVAYPG